jgi:hypothetical protein
MRIKLLLLFIIFSVSAFAHSDHYASYQKGNLYFQYRVGWEEMEINNKIKILIHLTEKLLIEKKTKDKIYINFAESHIDSAYCTVGFGNFVYEDFHKNHRSQHIGLKINIVNYDVDIKELLNLVSVSLNNVSIIKRDQKQEIIDLHERLNGVDQYDTLISIPSQIVSQYKITTDKLVEKLINIKTYSNLSGPETFWNLDYYYQNNKFHFYNTSEPETKYNPRTGNDDIVKTFGEDILVVNNITETTGDWNYGHFVFINDSTFYYIPKIKSDVQGPFKLDSIRFGRPPVRNLNYEYFGYDRFTMYFDNYLTITKALFIPEKKILINNYHVLEGKSIQNYIDSIEIPKEEKKKEYSLILMILPFLIISIIFNIWLIQKRKK